MRKKIVNLAFILVLVFSCKSKVAPPPPPVLAPAETVVLLEKPTGNAVEGKILYENNCGKCHSLYAPKDFTKDAWQPILIRMQRQANLNDKQMTDITGYIHSQL